MKNNAKLLMLAAVAGVLVADGALAQSRTSKQQENITGEVLFKIHDVVPEKDAEGNVQFCNMGATFFNRTNVNISNSVVKLVWHDDVIGEIIDLEERAEKEAKRVNPKAVRSRYPTADLTSDNINVTIKLPQMRSNQQVSLTTKVDTDRCFLLLNEMDVEILNCGTAAVGSGSRGKCDNLYRYIGSKMPEYYTEFKEISWEQQLSEEAAAVKEVEKEVRDVFDETMNLLHSVYTDTGAAVSQSDE